MTAAYYGASHRESRGLCLALESESGDRWSLRMFDIPRLCDSLRLLVRLVESTENVPFSLGL